MSLCIEIYLKRKSVLTDPTIKARKWKAFIHEHIEYAQLANEIYNCAIKSRFYCPSVYFMSNNLVLLWENDPYFVSVYIPTKGPTIIAWGRSYQEPRVQQFRPEHFELLSDYLYPEKPKYEKRT